MKSLLCIIVSILSSICMYAQSKNFIDQPYIEVSGTADTLVTPNEIYIRILISEKDSRDRISIEESEQKLVGALQSLGLNPEKDLVMNDMSSNYQFYVLKNKDVIKSKLYNLKVTDAITASRVFIKLEEIGISNSSIERVGYTDLHRMKNLMRLKAVEDAKERAIMLTKPLNQTVGPAIHISETDNLSEALQGRVAGIRIRGSSTFDKNNDTVQKIEFEKIRISSGVSIQFILK